jgi:hypothetical protein
MIFTRDTHTQALEEIRAALREEKHDEERAEVLAAIAIDYDVPIEFVMQWIHLQPVGQPWSISGYIGVCREYSAFRRETAARFAEFVQRCSEGIPIERA